MSKECISCQIINTGGQSARDVCQSTIQCFLLGCLGFIADSQLLCIAVAGAYEGRSKTLATGVSTEIALDKVGCVSIS